MVLIHPDNLRNREQTKHLSLQLGVLLDEGLRTETYFQQKLRRAGKGVGGCVLTFGCGGTIPLLLLFEASFAVVWDTNR